MKKAWVYILECADGSFYTGNAEDLESRMYQHQNGEGSSWIKGRL